MYTSLIVTNMLTKVYSSKSVNAYSVKVDMSIKNP